MATEQPCWLRRRSQVGWKREPLDVGNGCSMTRTMLSARLSILSIAHLNDAGADVFRLRILLNESRSLGCGANRAPASLRAILYMDEVYGYFPPIGNPPAKRPMLTSAKTSSRVSVVGVRASDPEPSRPRLQGLIQRGHVVPWSTADGTRQVSRHRGTRGGVSPSRGRVQSRKDGGRRWRALGSRVFLMNNVHEDEPVVFQTRWALSYLRGPLTRNQIRVLMADRRQAGSEKVAEAPTPAPAKRPKPPARSCRPASMSILSPSMPASPGCRSSTARWCWCRPTSASPTASSASISGRRGPISHRSPTGRCRSTGIAATNCRPSPTCDPIRRKAATFAALPSVAAKKTSYKNWRSEFSKWLYRNALLTAQQISREVRDAVVAKIRDRYQSKVDRAVEKVRKMEQRFDAEEEKRRAAQFDAVISTVGSLFGRSGRGRVRAAAPAQGSAISKRATISAPRPRTSKSFARRSRRRSRNSTSRSARRNRTSTSNC